jgi:hypothetical protein
MDRILECRVRSRWAELEREAGHSLALGGACFLPQEVVILVFSPMNEASLSAGAEIRHQSITKGLIPEDSDRN